MIRDWGGIEIDIRTCARISVCRNNGDIPVFGVIADVAMARRAFVGLAAAPYPRLE